MTESKFEKFNEMQVADRSVAILNAHLHLLV